MSTSNNDRRDRILILVFSAIALLILPFILQSAGNFWVRIADFALLYVLLALGLNIVVGYAGLLDLGFVAFFAQLFPRGLHTSIWLVVPLSAAVAGTFGILLGAPTLKLRGDYLAIVTLGFGEIIRVFMNNLDRPVNITNGPKGLGEIDPITIFSFKPLGIPGINLGKSHDVFGYTI